MANFTDQFLSRLTVEPGRKGRLVFDAKPPGLGVRVSLRKRKDDPAKTETLRTFLVQWTDRATRQKRREVLGVWGNITIDAAGKLPGRSWARWQKVLIRARSASSSGSPMPKRRQRKRSHSRSCE